MSHPGSPLRLSHGEEVSSSPLDASHVEGGGALSFFDEARFASLYQSAHFIRAIHCINWCANRAPTVCMLRTQGGDSMLFAFFATLRMWYVRTRYAAWLQHWELRWWVKRHLRSLTRTVRCPVCGAEVHPQLLWSNDHGCPLCVHDAECACLDSDRACDCDSARVWWEWCHYGELPRDKRAADCSHVTRAPWL
jgi:hypothetical protein